MRGAPRVGERGTKGRWEGTLLGLDPLYSPSPLPATDRHVLASSKRNSGIRIEYAKQRMGEVSQPQLLGNLCTSVCLCMLASAVFTC